jgi:hypothetical protein
MDFCFLAIGAFRSHLLHWPKNLTPARFAPIRSAEPELPPIDYRSLAQVAQGQREEWRPRPGRDGTPACAALPAQRF